MTVKNSVFGRKCVRNRKSSYSFRRSLASDEVRSEKTGVNAEKYVPKSP